MVSIELIGFLRDIAQADKINMPITHESTARDALDYVERQYPALSLDKASFLITVNHELASPDKPLRSGDLVCLVPHIGGG